MATIRLQLIKGFFYPTDAASRKILEDSLRVDRIPLERIDVVSPKLVKAGHALAITGWDPPPVPVRFSSL
jgi:hypothetical protein